MEGIYEGKRLLDVLEAAGTRAEHAAARVEKLEEQQREELRELNTKIITSITNNEGKEPEDDLYSELVQQRKSLKADLKDAKEHQKAMNKALKRAQIALDRHQEETKRSREGEGVLPPSKKQKRDSLCCDKASLHNFNLDVVADQETWAMPSTLYDIIDHVDPGFLSQDKVFIRKPMLQLLYCLENRHCIPDHPNVERMQYVLGSPGVGKSMLLFLFAVSQFVQKNVPFVFLRQISVEGGKYCVVVEKESVLVIENINKEVCVDWREHIHSLGGKYYVDGIQPSGSGAVWGEKSDFWVTSAMFNQKDESKGELLYLSAWSEEEIKAGFKALGRSEAEADLHYRIIGGSFRHIGENKLQLTQLMKESVKKGETVKVDRLYHTFVSEPHLPETSERRLASEFVIDVLRMATLEHLLKVYKDNVSESVRGGIFQVITEKWIELKSSGNDDLRLELKCRNITLNNQEEKLELLIKEVRFPNGSTDTRLANIKGEDKVMYCPNFPGCDKLLFSDNVLYLLNDTVAASHKCTWDTFKAAIECMGQNKKNASRNLIIYLVPNQDIRDAFKPKDITSLTRNNFEVLVGFSHDIDTYLRGS